MLFSMLAAFICCCFAIDASEWSKTTFAETVNTNNAETLVVSNLVLTNANMMFLYDDEIFHILNNHPEIKHLIFINVSVDNPRYFFQKLEFVETVALMSFRTMTDLSIEGSFLFANCRRLSKVDIIDSPGFDPETDGSFYFMVPHLYAYWSLYNDSFDEGDEVVKETEPIDDSLPENETTFGIHLPTRVSISPMFKLSFTDHIIIAIEYSCIAALLVVLLIQTAIDRLFEGVFNDTFFSFQ